MSNDAVFLPASKCIQAVLEDAGAADSAGDGQALVGASPTSASTVTMNRVLMSKSPYESLLLHSGNVENVQSVAVWRVDLEAATRGDCDVLLSPYFKDHRCRVDARARLEVPQQLARA